MDAGLRRRVTAAPSALVRSLSRQSKRQAVHDAVVLRRQFEVNAGHCLAPALRQPLGLPDVPVDIYQCAPPKKSVAHGDYPGFGVCRGAEHADNPADRLSQVGLRRASGAFQNVAHHGSQLFSADFRNMALGVL